MDSNSLIELVKAKMPYGKYKGCYVTDLPEYYLVWYKDKGFPKGKLGELMALQFGGAFGSAEKRVQKVIQKEI